MEKIGEILNQLAIISDLLEHANIESQSINVVFNVSDKVFDIIYKKVIEKVKLNLENLDNTFSLKIGEIKFVFNKSNV
jgi:hypothetical protein